MKSSSVTPGMIKQAVKSAVSEEDKVHNVMVFSLNETMYMRLRTRLVDEIMEQLNVWPKRNIEIEHVGERKEGYIRPMKLRMERKEFVLEVLAGSREERSAHKELV